MLKRVLVVALMAIASTALARMDVTCKVDGVERSVQFMTGQELNRAASTFQFSSYEVYALLWYSQNQVAILEHTGYAIGISGTFDLDDLENLYRIGLTRDFKQVNGSGSRRMSIDCKSFGRWIDPRLR